MGKEKGIIMANCFVALVLLFSSVLAPSQTTSSPAGAGSTSEGNRRKSATITGCLIKNSHNEYELVDEKGTRNLLYGSADLQSYVGQTVTVLGAQSVIPSTDTGTARPMPHFKVREVQSASGKCRE